MVQSDYALSYNVRNMVYDFLKKAGSFDTWKRTDNFVTWFNKVIDAKGRVAIAEICNKMKLSSIEQYDRIGFSEKINSEDVRVIEQPGKSRSYSILFPVLRDFTQKGVR